MPMKRGELINMKLKNLLQTLTPLIAMLIFSTAFVIYAEQNAMIEQTVPAAGCDAQTVILEAKADAEQDASRDVNKLAWFGAGMTGFIGGAGIGSGVGLTIDEPEVGAFLGLSEGMVIGCLVGSIVGSLITLIWVANRKPPHPSPERLIGKSPEYVDQYMDAYRKEIRSRRTQAAVVGACALPGCIGLGITLERLGL